MSSNAVKTEKLTRIFDKVCGAIISIYGIKYNMNYVEIILSFVIGAILIVFTGWVFSLKTKGIFRLLINTAVGGIVLFVLSLTNVAALPINPLNALIVGFLGVPGIALIFLIVLFL